MRIVHLYPFAPVGRHGGTLRLRAAVAASARIGEPSVHWFDPQAGGWRGPAELADLEALLERRPASTAADHPTLKRRLFPSTLWESGARARRALRGHLDRLELGRTDLVALHTTYLAPALALPPLDRRRCLVDAYDLVWLAHRNDAVSARWSLAAVRRAYAAAVRVREQRALARAGALAVAGHRDQLELRGRFPAARWVPTPTPIGSPAPEPSAGGDALRVGLLGNFAHCPTAESAEVVLASELARDPTVRVVLAGLGSDAGFSSEPGVEILGPVARAEDFYALVDCVVAPVSGGSGMKVKLAEAVLAGRPVITTALGASGLSPELARHLFVCDPRNMNAAAVRAAIAQFDAERALRDFERVLGWEAATAGYASLLAELAGL